MIAALTLMGAVLVGISPRPVQAQTAPLIASVDVEKNEYISRDAILDSVKDILKIGDPLTDKAVADARNAILRMGYFEDVTISREVVKDGVRVIISVVEKQRIEKIVFVGNTVVGEKALQEAMRSKVGHIVDQDIIRRDVQRIEEYYTKQGYIARVAQARVDKFGVLTIVVDEARIEGFKIEGLKKTKEWVVRRLIETKPGSLFRQETVAKDIQRIFNMGIFQNVKSDLRAGEVDPTAVIVVIQVEEKRTGVASVAAAYSDLDKFVLMLSVAETNFRGRAERVSVDGELFGRTSYNVSFFEPFLDRKNTTLDVSLFNTQQRRRFIGGGIATNEDQFQERRIGASVRASRPMSPTQRLSLGLRTEEVTSSFLNATRDLGPIGGLGPQAVHPSQINQGGSSGTPSDPNAPPPGPGDGPGDLIVGAPLHPGGRVNSTTVEYTWDTRDLVADPNHGAFRDVSFELAGSFLGGANNYTLYSAEQRLYLPMRGKKDVLALRLMTGASSGDLPLFDSFSIGGATNLRGYRQDRFRGESMVLGNLEYRYRMSESLGLVAFVDVGDAFGGTFPTVVPGFNVPADDQKLNLHVGTGIGLRAKTPLGPIRIDYGVGNEGSEVHFGFGQIF
jgi:outer membrane protein insertion porin family